MTKSPRDVPPEGTSPMEAASNLARAPLDAAQDQASRRLLAQVIRAIYPHETIGEAPYVRTADAVLAAAAASPAQKVTFAAALHDLAMAGFDKLDAQAAHVHLRSIERTAFFRLIRSTAVVAFYDDPEVWEILGYEGPSFDKGGYINRGFNDLDWLPEPRIDEYEAIR